VAPFGGSADAPAVTWLDAGTPHGLMILNGQFVVSPGSLRVRQRRRVKHDASKNSRNDPLRRFGRLNDVWTACQNIFSEGVILKLSSMSGNHQGYG